MVRDFQSLISAEARAQAIETTGGLPDSVVACAGGGSNTMGSFGAFLGSAAIHPGSEVGGRKRRGNADASADGEGDGDQSVDLYAVEAGGSSLEVDAEAGVAPNSASLATGEEGILHGARTKVLQDPHGQVMESHSVSSGLDYAGVGPELAHLVETGRVAPVDVDDDAALEAFHRLSRLEGIIPALETAHAFGFLEQTDEDLGTTVVTVSGRGDKDLESVVEETAQRDLEEAPDMDVFEKAETETGAGGSR
jgi:tryptophan synthase beta chain